ncbi:MAG TPA: tetratricopeptide repeat protein, partial [Nitrospiraceae bacterium]|nr:tetratricopeptide repeat protein [Nitrospiraceae bacterium]
RCRETMNGDYSSADLCRILRLSASGLRSCLHAALLSEHSTRYSFQHLVILRTAKGLHAAGVSMRQIRKVLDSLQRQLGEGEALSSLNIYAAGKHVVVWDGMSHWQPDSGQFLLNFETTQLAKPIKHIRRRPRVQPSNAEAALTWFGRAMELQDESPEAARRAYHEAICLQPTFIEAHLNLGLLYHDDGNLKDAEACYRRAVHYGPALALAHFNLAVVLEDQDDKDGAITAYKEALKSDPTFREAHANLAQLYERLGRRRDAFRHYAAARRLTI